MKMLRWQEELKFALRDAPPVPDPATRRLNASWGCSEQCRWEKPPANIGEEGAWESPPRCVTRPVRVLRKEWKDGFCAGQTQSSFDAMF